MPRRNKRNKDERHTGELELTFQPLTPDRWEDFEQLMGEHGAWGGCWCMFWRLSHADFDRGRGESNRRAMRAIVKSGEVPGILAYQHGEPVGWCAVAPREVYTRLSASRTLSRTLAPVDDQPVWSIVCLYVAKPHRRKGISAALVGAAVDYVRSRGGRIVEGYPLSPRRERVPSAAALTGFESAFVQVGFVEVVRRSETRPVMRYVIGSNSEVQNTVGRIEELSNLHDLKEGGVE